MRILFVHNRYQQYGGEDAVFDAEIALLRLKGHQVEALIFENKKISSLKEKLKIAFTSIYNIYSARLLSQKIKIFQPDIIHVHNFWKEASPAVFWVANQHKIPVVFTLHNYRLICANALLMRENQICELCISKKFPFSAVRYACFGNRLLSFQTILMTGLHKIVGTWRKKVAHYIALTDFAKEKFLASSLQISENQISVKPNFVEDTGFSPAEQRENYYLFVGRLSEEKGIKHILQLAKHSSICIEIIGKGAYEESIQKLSDTQNNVKFWGFKDKKFIVEKMKKAKALIVPSLWYEGLPTTILEAFSTGTPVIVSAIGNLNEIVTHQYNGWHFSVNEADSLVKQISCFENYREKEKIYENAYQTFKQRYSSENVYQKLIDIYTKLITKS